MYGCKFPFFRLLLFGHRSFRLPRGLFFFITFALTQVTQATEPTQAVDLTKPVEDVGAWAWVEGTRDRVSKGIGGMGRSIDDWLAGEIVGEHTNETYLKVEFNQVIGSIDGYDSNVKIGGKLDLPRASQRWKLIFDSDVNELNSLNQNTLDDVSSGVAIGGFRFEQETDSGWDFSHDIGLRAKVPLDAFYRFRAGYGLELGEFWSMGFRQKFWYYDSRGHGYDSRLYFDRKIDSSRILRIHSEINYQGNDNELEFGQSVSLHQSLGELETLSYAVGVLGRNQPNTRIDDYYAQTTYRRAIRDDWLILEVAPQILVSRYQNWNPQARFIINLEMYFFDF